MVNAERYKVDADERYEERDRATEYLRDLEPRHDVRGGFAAIFGVDKGSTPRSFTGEMAS